MKKLLILAGLTIAMATSASAQEKLVAEANFGKFTLEVVENGLLFSPDLEPGIWLDENFEEVPVDEFGNPTDPDAILFPTYGGEFITGGILYPSGTITCGPDGLGGLACNGLLEDGTPEFPDKVIGTWTCRGWHVGEGAFTATGAWTATNQIYSFTAKVTEEYGAMTITTDGFESPEPKRVQRAITGGTGSYAGLRGEQGQRFLGWNPSFGIALAVDFRISRFFRGAAPLAPN